jgi:mono/diheme cytochrome c family protein
MRRSRVIAVMIGSLAAILLSGVPRSPTYRREVFPVLNKNCLSCHSPGRVAPMSFATYEDARPWARQMKTVVTQKKMPPGIVEKHYGLFGDDGTLTQSEIDLIVEWVDAGAPEGSAQDAAP